MGAHVDQGDLWLFAVGDAGAGVKCDRIPNQLGFRFRVTVFQQEAAGSVGAVDLKTLVGCKFVRQTQVVQQCGEIDSLAVVFQANAGDRCENNDEIKPFLNGRGAKTSGDFGFAAR